MLAKARPDLFTAMISKQRRPRARPDAGVSVPLSWDELDAKDDVRPRFTVKNVPERLARLGADPWADYAAMRQSITAGMRKSLGSE